MMSRARLKEKVYEVLHLGDSPQRTAMAFAVGVFIAFSPTYGLHTLTVLFCAWAFRLNFVALFLAAFINNPWTFLPIVGASMWVGLLLIPQGQPPVIDWNHFTILMLWEQLRPFVVPFVLGSTLLGFIAAILTFPLAYLGILRFRKRQAQPHRLAPPFLSC